MQTYMVESRDSWTFAACCWYLDSLASAGPATTPVLLSVSNARDRATRRVSCLAVPVKESRTAVWVRQDGMLQSFSFWVVTSEALSTDGRPEPYRRLHIRGSCGGREEVLTLVNDALNAYRVHCSGGGGDHDGEEGAVPQWTWDEDTESWCRGRTRRARSMATLFLPPGADDLVEDFRDFCSPESSARYRDLHVAPTRVYMLHGIPGSGKSSLVHCVASETGRGIASLSFSPSTTDADVRAALATLPPRCLLCVEDVDCLFSDFRKTSSAAAGITFAGLLAALDGCCAEDGSGTGIFLTTNRLCALDAALRRRVDYVAEFGAATKTQCRALFQWYFPDRSASSGTGGLFEEFWAAAGCGSKRFSMSALQKYLLKALRRGGDPVADVRRFDDLVACAALDSSAATLYL